MKGDDELNADSLLFWMGRDDKISYCFDSVRAFIFIVPVFTRFFFDKTVAPLVGSLAKIANETQMKKDLGNMLG